jgi:hypothetical protein
VATRTVVETRSEFRYRVVALRAKGPGAPRRIFVAEFRMNFDGKWYGYADHGRNSSRVPLRGSRAARGGGFGLAGERYFWGVPEIFSSFQIFKPYKSSDAVAEVNLYGLAELGVRRRVVETRSEFRYGVVALRAEGDFGLAGERFFGVFPGFFRVSRFSNHTSLLTRSRR